MNILIFATGDFYQKPNPSFHLLTSWIDDFLEDGNKIHHVGIEEEGLDRHIPERFLENPAFTYDLVKLKPEDKGNFIKRYFRGFAYAFKAKKYLKKAVPQSDIIFLRSSPTVLFNILAVKKYVKNQKIVYGVQDMFPGSTVASGKMNNKLLQKIFYSLQKKVYKKSDIIVAISEDMKTRLLEQGVPDEKIRVIVNWFDDKSVKEIPREENLFVKKYNMSPDKFYVQYAGTMGFVFDYKTVIETAKILKDKKDIVFQMIGEGSQKESFIKEAKENGLDNIVFLPLEPQEMVPHVYSACSVCFIPLKKNIIGNSVPSKAGLLMACGRAIVNSVDEDSDYYSIFGREEIGISASNSDPQSVADAILKMYEDKDFRDRCQINAKEYSKYYSRTHSLTLYKELFKELTDK